MLNKCFLMGRMVKDPEVRKAGEYSVCSFTIAVDRDFSKGAEKQTDFIDCVAWRQTAEFIGKSFTKGRMMIVGGKLQIRDWEDKNGNKRRTAEVLVEDVYFGDSRPVPLGETRSVNVQFEELGEEESGELPF